MSSTPRQRERRLNAEQLAWFRHYKKQSGFEPMMDGFFSGEKTFVEAAKFSIRWFQDWSEEVVRLVERVPGADDE